MFGLSAKSWWGLLAAPLLVAVLVACAPTAGTDAPTAGTDAPTAGVITGPDVGNVAPEFTMTRPDGEQVALSHLDAADQPAHLFFFASW